MSLKAPQTASPSTYSKRQQSKGQGHRKPQGLSEIDTIDSSEYDDNFSSSFGQDSHVNLDNGVPPLTYSYINDVLNLNKIKSYLAVLEDEHSTFISVSNR